jgi:two-component system, NtrC family, sensor kinase
MAMGKLFVLLILSTLYAVSARQQTNEDSLKRVIKLGKGDSEEVKAMFFFANLQTQPDTAIMFARQGLRVAQQINYKKGEADCLFTIAKYNSVDLAEVIQSALKALKIYSSLKDYSGSATTHLILQGGYRDLGDYKNSLVHAFAGKALGEQYDLRDKYVFPGTRIVTLFLAEISQTFLLMNQLDSAQKYAELAIDQKELFHGAEWNFPVYLLAEIQNKEGKFQSALKGYHMAVPLAIQNKFFRDTLQIFSGLSTLFQRMVLLDSSIHYASMVVHSKGERENKTFLEALYNIAAAYKAKGMLDSALKYTEMNHSRRDSLFNMEKDREIQNFVFNEKLKQEKIISEQEKFKTRIQLISFVAGLFVLLVLAIILWRSYQLQKVAKIKVENAYKDLQVSQAQLIQSEKMASLGELTAGIAHEIQNPLNFVNNFSEVNSELINEMQTELEAGHNTEATAISNEIKDNQEKITLHGKRADSIVKSMLLHSRSSSGQKELTDINQLADEYLRLVYHGVRAKDKNFNATLQTDFDPSIGKINIIPQNIGRVFINLYNNAFYALSAKSAAEAFAKDEALAKTISSYQPVLVVSTKKIADKVCITVKDNGNGIPQKVVDKIFQPFFTTKPTGQGTGLGLSLSYDIVKAHGGEIKVETKEGEGSMFIIQLPEQE